MELQLDQFVTLGSWTWLKFGALVIAGRALDLGSTYAGTPNLLLEGSPLARRMGWRLGIPLNLAAGLLSGCWPLLAIGLATMSAFVAARNLQNAWIMRSMGEREYRTWMTRRLMDSPRWSPFACYFGEAALSGIVALSLIVFAEYRLVPCGIGIGLLLYALTIAFFTGVELLRSR
ncbi:MAG TPA: hypothetical protein VMF06_06020 [Candidatus Limnocylindria bacterium]|nr:hypothetical protein [Candidatus Limnocylindria bacterium]